MKKLTFIILTSLIIATPALARHKCKPYIKNYWRSANGRNVVQIGWNCKGSGNGYSVRTNEICAVTENRTTVCADGYKNLSITGGSTKLEFDRSEYPIKRLFIKK